SEIVPRLYVSDLSAAEDPATLAAHGITHVLSAMPLPCPPPAHRARTHLCVPLQDTPFAELVAHRPRTTQFIAAALRDPRARVLVHCAMGASRSVSVVCAYLVARHGLSPSAAVAHVRARRACAAPNWGFVMQLEEYARSLDEDAEGSDDDDMCS
ncbi:protein-tyrosine phosphatase-like protein, partial [Amylostereum chailletii]